MSFYIIPTYVLDRLITINRHVAGGGSDGRSYARETQAFLDNNVTYTFVNGVVKIGENEIEELQKKLWKGRSIGLSMNQLSEIIRFVADAASKGTAEAKIIMKDPIPESALD